MTTESPSLAFGPDEAGGGGKDNRRADSPEARAGYPGGEQQGERRGRRGVGHGEQDLIAATRSCLLSTRAVAATRTGETRA